MTHFAAKAPCADPAPGGKTELRGELLAALLGFFKQRYRRGAILVYFGKVGLGAVPLGQIALIQSFLGDHLQMGVVKPVAVFMEIADPGKDLPG